jgi:hypothetical protein
MCTEDLFMPLFEWCGVWMGYIRDWVLDSCTCCIAWPSQSGLFDAHNMFSLAGRNSFDMGSAHLVTAIIPTAFPHIASFAGLAFSLACLVVVFWVRHIIFAVSFSIYFNALQHFWKTANILVNVMHHPRPNCHVDCFPCCDTICSASVCIFSQYIVPLVPSLSRAHIRVTWRQLFACMALLNYGHISYDGTRAIWPDFVIQKFQCPSSLHDLEKIYLVSISCTKCTEWDPGIRP